MHPYDHEVVCVTVFVWRVRVAGEGGRPHEMPLGKSCTLLSEWAGPGQVDGRGRPWAHDL